MSNYYKEVPVSRKPDLNRRVYFCLDASGGYYKCLYHDGKWIADGSAQDVTEYITHYLQPIEPVGLTDEEIEAFCSHKNNTGDFSTPQEKLAVKVGARRGSKLARDHYSLLLSAEKERQGELMEVLELAETGLIDGYNKTDVKEVREDFGNLIKLIQTTLKIAK